jgi:thiamine-monophosphate kinase
MKLASVGEFGLIEIIRRGPAGGRKIAAGWRRGAGEVVLGIGDDAAIFRPGPGFDLLLTTDLLLEGVHFDRNCASWVDVGYKSVVVNVSDIAAMGGIPRAYLVSLAVPADLTVEGVGSLYTGMRQAAREADLVLAGGNIASSSDKIFVNLTLIGEVERGMGITRSGARQDDLLFVTGTLGDSAAGLELLKRGRGVSTGWDRMGGGRASGKFSYLVRRHLRPTARWREGRALTRIASAMIDLSDGLSSDLGHLCDESGVGAVVGAALLPFSSPLKAFCRLRGKSPLDYALCGGEDYELLFAVPRRRIGELEKLVRRGKIKATPIGRVVSKRRGCWLVDSEGAVPLRRGGYDHFRSGRS